MTGNRDVGTLGYESVCFLEWSAATVHLYFSLHFYKKMAVIVLSKDVDNCLYIIACLPLFGCKECKCLLDPVMFNLSGSLFRIMNNLLLVGLCEPLFLAQTYLSNFLPHLPLSILPSFPPHHTLHALRLIYFLEIWHEHLNNSHVWLSFLNVFIPTSFLPFEYNVLFII